MTKRQSLVAIAKRNAPFVLAGILVFGIAGYFTAGTTGRELGGGIGAVVGGGDGRSNQRQQRPGCRQGLSATA